MKHNAGSKGIQKLKKKVVINKNKSGWERWGYLGFWEQGQ